MLFNYFYPNFIILVVSLTTGKNLGQERGRSVLLQCFLGIVLSHY